MKRCPYCFGEHRRYSRYCCEAHAKASARHDATVRAGRERAITAIRRQMHERAKATA